MSILLSGPNTDGPVAARRSARRGNRSPPLAEFDLLRGIACLGVVAIHALTIALGNPAGTSRAVTTVLEAAQLLLMFSTPTFVFLSALLVGYAYEQPPTGFLRRRARYIAVPFVSMCVVYATFLALKSLLRHGDMARFRAELLIESARNLVGGNHLWFILPILQFYVLYALLGGRLRQVRPAVLLGAAFIVNVAYLGFFNFAPPMNHTYGAFVGSHWYSFLFPAWVFYFVLGLYMGLAYSEVSRALRQQVRVIFVGLGLAATGVLYLHFSSHLHDVSSRRVDILVYTLFAIAALLWVATRLRAVPQFFSTISRYSFGIYILHPMCLELVAWALDSLGRFTMPMLLVGLWVGGTGASILGTRVLASLPFGSMLIGQLRPRATSADPAPSTVQSHLRSAR